MILVIHNFFKKYIFYLGISKDTAYNIATFLGFEKEGLKQASDEILKLWKLFIKVDALQLEINPLAGTDKKDVISVDAKISFDDNAKYRQSDIFAIEHTSETDPREVEAAKFNLNYINMTGNIGFV